MQPKQSLVLDLVVSPGPREAVLPRAQFISSLHAQILRVSGKMQLVLFPAFCVGIVG